MATAKAKRHTLTSQLRAAGIEIKSARGCWGGVTPDGTLVVTAWISEDIGGRSKIWRPRKNHKGLLDAWKNGSVSLDTLVRLVKVTSRARRKEVSAAELLPGFWRIVEIVDGGAAAFVERA